MTKLPSDDELRDAFWTGYAAASWGEKEVSGMRACAVLAIARMNERAASPEPSEAQDAARYRWLRERMRITGRVGGYAATMEVRVPAFQSTANDMDAAIDAALRAAAAARGR